MVFAEAVTIDGEVLFLVLLVLVLVVVVGIVLTWAAVRCGVALGHTLARHEEPWRHSRIAVVAAVVAAIGFPWVIGASEAADRGGLTPVLPTALVALVLGVAIGWLGRHGPAAEVPSPVPPVETTADPSDGASAP